MNKKGIGEGAVIIASIFLFVLITLLAIVFFNMLGIKVNKEIIGSVESNNEELLLINILRTEVDGEKDIADLLVEGYGKNDYGNSNEKLKQVIDKIYSEDLFEGFLIVKLMPDNKMIFTSSGFSSNPLGLHKLDINVPTANIPIDEKKYLEVSLHD